MDESFYIPPASQLDASVFEALPEHYKVKISESYAREKARRAPGLIPKHQGTPTVVPPSATQDTKTVVNTNDDNAVDVMTIFGYYRENGCNILERTGQPMVMFSHSVNMC